MKDLWHGYVSVGIIHGMAFPAYVKNYGTAVDSARLICKDSFWGAIEIMRVADPALKEQMKKVLDSSGIRVVIAGQPPLLGGKLNINSDVEEERKKAVEDVKKSIDDAAFFKAEKIAILSGPMPAAEKKEAAKKALLASLKELSGYAKSKNVALCLETFDETVDKKCFVGGSKFSAEIAAEVRKEFPAFGLALDLSHLPLLNEKPAFALNAVKKVLTHVHVGNCYVKDTNTPAYGDNHPRFSFPGAENSIDDLADFIRELFKCGYLSRKQSAHPPIVSFEVKPLPEEDPELVLADAKRAWTKAWSLV